jgi:hypothetical protein
MADIKKAVGLKGPVSTTSLAPEDNPVSAGTPATPVVVPVITTELDTFEEEDGTPETLLSPLMDELRQVAEGGAMTSLRKRIDTCMPEEKVSAQSYLKALQRLKQAAESAASVGQESFVARFGN